MKLTQKMFFMAVCLLAYVSPARGQQGYYTSLNVENSVSEASLYADINFLADSLCHGRATGTIGAVEASYHIMDSFRSLGLLPFNDNYFQSFTAEGVTGHNVVGVLKNNELRYCDKYIIVCAHYDNLGRLDGKLYPGADSNASGVAAMLALAKMFSTSRAMGRYYGCHIIFAGLDAKQFSMAGSKALWNKLDWGLLTSPVTGKRISPKDIALVVNLDILGGSSSPIHKGRNDYLLILGGKHNDLLSSLNYKYKIYLDLGTDYYGSKGFTDMFLRRVSDQKVFLDHKIYSVMFTSGISMDTNRTSDTCRTIDLPVLKKRVCLIFHWIEEMVQSL